MIVNAFLILISCPSQIPCLRLSPYFVLPGMCSYHGISAAYENSNLYLLLDVPSSTAKAAETCNSYTCAWRSTTSTSLSYRTCSKSQCLCSPSYVLCRNRTIQPNCLSWKPTFLEQYCCPVCWGWIGGRCQKLWPCWTQQCVNCGQSTGVCQGTWSH